MSAMAELATLALACDARVVSFMFSLPAAHVYYRHLAANMNDDFHDIICHGDPGDQSNQPRVDTGVLYAMKCLSEFLAKLRDTAHGTSNLLDNTLVYVTSDTAWGKTHAEAEWPVLMLGKAGGRLRGDEHQHFPGENLSKALFTVARIMGSSVPELGLDAGHVTEPLAGIGVLNERDWNSEARRGEALPLVSKQRRCDDYNLYGCKMKSSAITRNFFRACARASLLSMLLMPALTARGAGTRRRQPRLRRRRVFQAVRVPREPDARSQRDQRRGDDPRLFHDDLRAGQRQAPG